MPDVALPAPLAGAFTMKLTGTPSCRSGARFGPRRRRRAATAGASGRVPARFRGAGVHAVAGIGDPARFFATLAALGIDAETHAFPDHHAFRPSDLDFAGATAILMTEKDAVKCESFADPAMWSCRSRPRSIRR